jgi:zinc transporter, ZIP family
MQFDNMLFAFSLTLFAGLATGIGGAIAFFANTTNTRFLSASLGFSAGVMIYVSFVEILPKAMESLIEQHGEQSGNLFAVLAFFGGLLFIALIDQLVPEHQNPHEMRRVEEMDTDPKRNDALMRMGLFSAGAIAIHNFPEGLATFVAAMADPQLGIAIAIAIAIHNIPEGITPMLQKPEGFRAKAPRVPP